MTKQKPSVLLVEDDDWLAESYIRQLSAYTRVQRVRSSQAAIDRIDEQPPKLIILDFVLDGVNGMTLLHELQSHDDLAIIPVVLLTSLADILGQSGLDEYGVVTVLDKAALTPLMLEQTVKRYLAT